MGMEEEARTMINGPQLYDEMARLSRLSRQHADRAERLARQNPVDNNRVIREAALSTMYSNSVMMLQGAIRMMMEK